MSVSKFMPASNLTIFNVEASSVVGMSLSSEPTPIFPSSTTMTTMIAPNATQSLSGNFISSGIQPSQTMSFISHNNSDGTNTTTIPSVIISSEFGVINSSVIQTIDMSVFETALSSSFVFSESVPVEASSPLVTSYPVTQTIPGIISSSFAPSSSYDYTPILPTSSSDIISSAFVPTIPSLETTATSTNTTGVTPIPATGNNLGLFVAVPVLAVLLLVSLIVICVCLRKRRNKNRRPHRANRDLWVENSNEPILPLSVGKRTKLSAEQAVDKDPGNDVGYYEVLFPFIGQADDQLTLVEHQIVKVVEKDEHGWWRGFVDDKSGWFPGNYVQETKNKDTVADSAVIDDLEQLCERNTPRVSSFMLRKRDSSISNPQSNGRPSSFQKPPEIPNGSAIQAQESVENTEVTPTDVVNETPDTDQAVTETTSTSNDKKGVRFKTLHPYTASREGDISIDTGDMLVAMETDGKGWMKGRKEESSEEGWFPETYVQNAEKLPVNYDEAYKQLDVNKKRKRSDVGHFVGIEHLAIHTYIAQWPEDLSFEIGDKVVVIDAVDTGWWMGCIGDQVGWFPGSYVQISEQASKEASPSPKKLEKAFSYSNAPATFGTFGKNVNKKRSLSLVPMFIDDAGPTATSSIGGAKRVPLRRAPAPPNAGDNSGNKHIARATSLVSAPMSMSSLEENDNIEAGIGKENAVQTEMSKPSENKRKILPNNLKINKSELHNNKVKHNLIKVPHSVIKSKNLNRPRIPPPRPPPMRPVPIRNGVTSSKPESESPEDCGIKTDVKIDADVGINVNDVEIESNVNEIDARRKLTDAIKKSLQNDNKLMEQSVTEMVAIDVPLVEHVEDITDSRRKLTDSVTKSLKNENDLAAGVPTGSGIENIIPDKLPEFQDKKSASHSDDIISEVPKEDDGVLDAKKDETSSPRQTDNIARKKKPPRQKKLKNKSDHPEHNLSQNEPMNSTSSEMSEIPQNDSLLSEITKMLAEKELPIADIAKEGSNTEDCEEIENVFNNGQNEIEQADVCFSPISPNLTVQPLQGNHTREGSPKPPVAPKPEVQPKPSDKRLSPEPQSPALDIESMLPHDNKKTDDASVNDIIEQTVLQDPSSLNMVNGDVEPVKNKRKNKIPKRPPLPTQLNQNHGPTEGITERDSISPSKKTSASPRSRKNHKSKKPDRPPPPNSKSAQHDKFPRTKEGKSLSLADISSPIPLSPSTASPVETPTSVAVVSPTKSPRTSLLFVSPEGYLPEHGGRRSSKATLRRAIDDYTAQGEGELSFEEGSFIKEINQENHRPGWCYGMLADGTTGYYPSSLVTDNSSIWQSVA